MFFRPSPVSSYFLFTCYLTDDTCCFFYAIFWNQTKPVCYFARGWTRSHTQVMRPSSASTLIASTRRSSFMSFPQEHDATVTASYDRYLPRHFGASQSSSQRSAASRVPTLSKLGALGIGLTKLLADRDSDVGRDGIKETCCHDCESIVDSNTGFTEQSDFPSHALPRFWIAAQNTEYCGSKFLRLVYCCRFHSFLSLWISTFPEPLLLP